MIFNYDSKIKSYQKLFELSKIKKLKILDFGCGKGVWDLEIIKNKKIKKIILFDKEKKLISFLKKKYTNKKIEINFNLNKIIKKNNFNLIVFFSVVQYMNKKELFETLKKLSYKKTFILSDVPVLPRILEFFLLPLFNWKRFIFALKIIFLNKYQMLNYYIYKKSDFKQLKKYFFITFHENLHDLKNLRYTVILRPKN